MSTMNNNTTGNETSVQYMTRPQLQSVINPAIFISHVIEKLGIIDDSSEPSENEKIFMAIMDYVSGLEFYSMFSKRTFQQSEEFMFSHPEITSIIMGANMLLQGYMEVHPEYALSVLDLFKGFTKAITANAKEYFAAQFKDYSMKDSPILLIDMDDEPFHEDTDLTMKFLKQIIDNPIYAIYRAFGTWQKVFILIHYHYGEIVTYLGDTKTGNRGLTL